MAKLSISQALAVFILLLNLGFSLTSPQWNRDIGQGVLLNSDHHSSLRGTFDAFLGDEDMVVAASHHMLDWSARRLTKTPDDISKVPVKTEPIATESRNRRIRESGETHLTKRHHKHSEDDSGETAVATFSESNQSHMDAKASNSSEPFSSIYFPGGARVTKFKRKPVMTHYEKLKARESISNDRLGGNKTETVRPQITVRNHEERVQKVRKRNRLRQKTMKVPTTTSSPTTWKYLDSKSHKTVKPRFGNTRDLHGASSKRSHSSEEQIESSRTETTTTTKKPQTRPTRRLVTTSSPQKSSTRTNTLKRGSVRYGDTIPRESRISSRKEDEAENQHKTDARRSQVRSRNAQDIPRIQKQENVSKNHESSVKYSDIRVSQPKVKETKTPKNSKFEVLEDKPTLVINDENKQQKHATSSDSVSAPNKNSSPQPEKNEKQNVPNQNVRKLQPPQIKNSQLYPLESPYYPQGLLDINGNRGQENRDSNGFYRPHIPYFGNGPPQHGYYFDTPMHGPRFGPDYVIPGFHHSPQVLSLRHSILESQQDPSTTTSEPYSFSIPNFRIPTIDYNHKGCKTLLREVKEVPVNHRNPSNFAGYRAQPRDPYLRRFKREVKSIVMTKECFFPEGVPQEAIQSRQTKLPESSTAPIPATVIIQNRQEKPQLQLMQRIPRPVQDSIKTDQILARKQKDTGEGATEDHLAFASSEYYVNSPHFDPLRGYAFD